MSAKTAFVFPGQGSQSVGMLSDMSEQHVAIVQTFGEASDRLGFDLWKLVCEGPDSELNKTEFTQPAILAASVAMWRVWQACGGDAPELLAGHSLGEYSALVCAGVIEFGDAAALVRKRGQLMQAAVPEGVGAMAAILGLEDAVIAQACDQAAEGEVVAAVNFNSPGQVVIAGHNAAVERAIELCKEAGAKRALKLGVSVPSHCVLMETAAKQLAEQLAETTINVPEIPVVHNVNGETTSDPDKIRENLVLQLYQPVLWVNCVGLMSAGNIEVAVECGPGKVLSGLIKRIDRSIAPFAIGSAAGLDKAIETLVGGAV